MILLDLLVIVPRLSRAMPELHEAHATLEQPPRDQCLPPVHTVSINIANMLRLPRHIERLRRFRLHAKRQLERFNTRIESWIEPLPPMLLVERAQQIELLPLRLRRRM